MYVSDNDLSGNHSNNQGEQSEAVKLASSTAILSPFIHYQLIFGQPFYPKEQQPERTRYYQRHKLIRYLCSTVNVN